MKSRVIGIVFFAFLFFLGSRILHVTYLWFVIPTVPPVYSSTLGSDLVWLQSSIGVLSFDSKIDQGVWFGKDEQQFYWDWYGMQTVGIIYLSRDQECAVHVEWTNGLETCLNPPSVQEEK